MERHLLCPICQDVFRQAVEVNCCTKCFCLGCISEHVRQSQPSGTAQCPNCRKPLGPGDWKENKPLQQLVSDLPVECKFKANGCTAKLTRGISAEHEVKCEYASVPCPNSSNCPRVLRKDMADHLKNCPFRPAPCPNACGQTLPPKLLDIHVRDQCPNVRVTCEACSASMLRKDLPDHKCAKTADICLFTAFGCSEKVPVGELDAHLNAKPTQHFELVLKAISSLQLANIQLNEKVSSLESENSSLRARISTLETAQQQLQQQSQAQSQGRAAAATSPDSKPKTGSKSDDSPDDDIQRDKKAARERLQAMQSQEQQQQQQQQQQSFGGGFNSRNSIELGVQLVMQLPTELQPKYSKLMRKPMLIAENLMMDARIDVLRRVQEFLEPHHLDIIAIEYAQKAMRFKSDKNYETLLREATGAGSSSGGSMRYDSKMLRRPSLTSSGSSITLSSPSSARTSTGGGIGIGLTGAVQTDWKLTGDVSLDEKVRSQHAYANAPDSQLATDILSLCQDESKAAYACLAILEHFTGYITGYFDYDENAKLVKSMREILTHAKLLFVKNPAESGSGILEVCDTFLSQLELMDRIVASKVPVQVQLADFSDANRARTLRDKLVELQQFELARDFSVRCQLPLDSVWLNWGMACLRERRFADAREVFKHILTPVQSTSAPSPMSSPIGRGMSGSLASSSAAAASMSNLRRAPSLSTKLLDSQRIVEGIVQALDPEFSQSKIEASPAKSSSGGSSPGLSLSGTTPDLDTQLDASQFIRIDPDARSECIFYLETYGSRKTTLAFFMRHRLLEECVQFSLRAKVDADLFVDVVIQYCMANSLLNELKHVMLNSDPSLVSLRPYLLASCKYFNEKKAFKLLVTFQIFMEDFSRAALTCIKVYLETQEYVHKIKCLEVAKDYFAEAIRRQKAVEAVAATAVPRSPVTPNSPAPGGSSSSQVLTMQDMEKYVDRINIQMEILQWIGPRLTTDPVLQAAVKQHPTFEQFNLFGPHSHRHVLAWTLLVSNTLLGLRIVSDVLKREDWRETFRAASYYAVRNLAQSQLNEYLRIIKSASSDEWFDVVISPIIEIMVKEKKDLAGAEKLAARLTGNEAKVDAFILLGKLKAAYLLAVKTSDKNMVRKIMEEAITINDTSTAKLCAKYLDLAASSEQGTPGATTGSSGSSVVIPSTPPQ